MPKPTVFIASSIEGLDIANAIAHYLRYDARVVTWTGAFDLSNTTMEDLEQRIAGVDFGAVVLSPDDQTTMRNATHSTPRDNVLLELGMLFGRVGRLRTFFVIPGDREMHLPTDLLGVTPATYDAEWAEEGKAREALSAAAGEIRAAINRLGPLESDVNAGTIPRQGDWADSPIHGTGTVPAPPTVQAAPGERHDGWAYFAEQGWLAPLGASELPATRWVAHPRFGLGEVIGHGPANGNPMELTVRFTAGIARIVVPPDVLFATRSADNKGDDSSIRTN